MAPWELGATEVGGVRLAPTGNIIFESAVRSGSAPKPDKNGTEKNLPSLRLLSSSLFEVFFAVGRAVTTATTRRTC